MQQPAVNAAVSVLEGVDEDERKGGHRRRHDRVHRTLRQAAGQNRPTLHELRERHQAAADEVHFLAVAADRRADKDLYVAPVGRRVAGVNDPGLEVEKRGLVGRIAAGRRPQGRYETLGTGRARSFSLDREEE